jgi:hypothetical protein
VASHFHPKKSFIFIGDILGENRNKEVVFAFSHSYSFTVRCHLLSFAMLDRFIELGYVVLVGVVPTDVAIATATKLRSVRDSTSARPNGWVKIFGSDGMDAYRKQAKLSSAICIDMENRLRNHWKSFYPNSNANDWHAVRSLPGGEKQPPHTDYSFPLGFAHLDHVNMPAGLIVALEPGTHLYVYGWNRLCADMREEKILKLDVGDAIIFRGDLIHAGGAYTTDNIRLHAYLDAPALKRPSNDTSLIPQLLYDDDDPLICPLYNCTTRSTYQGIKKHILRVHRARFSNKEALGEKSAPSQQKPVEETEKRAKISIRELCEQPVDKSDKQSKISIREPCEQPDNQYKMSIQELCKPLSEKPAKRARTLIE